MSLLSCYELLDSGLLKLNMFTFLMYYCERITKWVVNPCGDLMPPKQTHNEGRTALSVDICFPGECKASDSPDICRELVKRAGSTLPVCQPLSWSVFHKRASSVFRERFHFSMIGCAHFKSAWISSFIITPCSWLKLQKCLWEHLHPLLSGKRPPRSSLTWPTSHRMVRLTIQHVVI